MEWGKLGINKLQLIVLSAVAVTEDRGGLVGKIESHLTWANRPAAIKRDKFLSKSCPLTQMSMPQYESSLRY